MDLLDLGIVLLGALAVYSGWKRGLTWVAGSFTGLIVGLIIGAAIAPPIARHSASHNPSGQSLIGTGIFLGCIVIFQALGTAVGYRVRIKAMRTRLAKADSVFGSGLAVIGVVVGAWFLGLTFAQSPYGPISDQIRNSAIIRGLDSIAPRPPAALAQIQELLHGNSFPLPFAGLGPGSLPDVAVPTDIDTPGIRAARTVTSKVIATGGCGGEAGSSWPIGNDHMITNAHVVAGSSQVVVTTPDGRQLNATVVLFDPDVDVAVLDVPGIGFGPLNVTGDPATGTSGAVIGYPHGGALTTVPGAVRASETATGRDIYGGSLTSRTIEVLLTPRTTTPDGQEVGGVIPGDSGGPMVDRNGNVVGLVFAASTTNPTEGYALAPSQISADVQAGRDRRSAVSTQDCTS